MDRDDELHISPGSSDYFNRADHGRGERKEEKRKNQKQDLLKLRRDMLAKDVAGKQSESFGTKTKDQLADEQTAKVDMKPAPDAMIEQSKQQEAGKDAASYEEQQNPS